MALLSVFIAYIIERWFTFFKKNIFEYPGLFFKVGFFAVGVIK